MQNGCGIEEIVDGKITLKTYQNGSKIHLSQDIVLE